MVINFKKSCCLRVGPRFNVPCAQINSLHGQTLSWVKEIKYLGIHLVNSSTMKCDLSHAKSCFYRGANEIFGKIGRIASVNVTLELIQSKCVPALLYGLEVLPLNKTQLNSLDFVVNRFFMKLFRTNDKHIISTCQDMFGFDIPSVQLERRRFLVKFENCK